jgi:hypothetical protein
VAFVEAYLAPPDIARSLRKTKGTALVCRDLLPATAGFDGELGPFVDSYALRCLALPRRWRFGIGRPPIAERPIKRRRSSASAREPAHARSGRPRLHWRAATGGPPGGALWPWHGSGGQGRAPRGAIRGQLSRKLRGLRGRAP